MVYADLGLTSDKVYRLAQQTANWLISEGIKPKDRIFMENSPFLNAKYWHLVSGHWAAR
ncbi:MAG: hypothetical protein Ct9H300mP29_0080 [Candidatus Neomarinimicrobiota bacterium]|nr:MAG: hypothetical protein Ct9H300mP29_0080 [Candidatus Neomarinimicrobiota bacterium]